jgi:hypothetical protein
MFETDPNIALSGIAFRNKINADHNRRIAESNARIAAGWERTALEVAEQRDKALAELADAKARIAELELALAVEKAHAGGMKAWKDAFKAAHPNSPVQADSGKRFKDRDVKTVGRLAYEAAFDRILRDARISNPEKYRAD